VSDDLLASLSDNDRSRGKSDAAFRTISEVAEELDVPQHVLRFWETKFNQVKPLKRGGGRRYYRPEDVLLLRRIRTLLYADGMTIRGVQKILRETGAKGVVAEAVPATPPPAAVTDVPPPPGGVGFQREEAVWLLGELRSLRDELRAVLR